MRKQVNKMTICMLLAFVLSACSSKVPQIVEITRIIHQTVMVTQIAEVDVESTPKPATETSAGTHTEPDESYYNGIVVIAQYYALFEQGLYEKTYQLLSPSRPHAISLEEFVANSEVLKIKETKIVTIRPIYESASQLQSRTTPDPLSRRMFYMQIYEEGENGMAGANTNGVHNYFITVVLENGEWKIYSINTSP